MIILILLGLLVAFISSEVLWLLYNGKNVPAPVVSRQTTVLGTGDKLTYLVLGDSTAAGQRGDYATGIAQTTANHLAQNHTVSVINLAVSGARAKDVEKLQLPKALGYKPDVVLVAVGANDVTHLTAYDNVQQSVRVIATKLIQQNCHAKILLTGSPGMGSVPRLPQPLRFMAGQRTKQINKHLDTLAADLQITRAPLAEKTGPIFSKNHALFAPDKFHPNSDGYRIWNPVLIAALDDAMTHQPSHCND